MQTRVAVDAAPVFVVFNPRSGKHDPPEDLRALFAATERVRDVFTVDGSVSSARVIERAAARAQAERGVLVAAGGDGTINATAQAAVEADVPFGVIARGTFNYFARRHGLPLDARGALDVILAGHSSPAQVGNVNGRVFLVNASLGFYPVLLQDRERFKREYGRTRLVAAWAGLVTLMREHRRLTLRVIDAEGEDAPPPRLLHTSTLFVGNNPLQLDDVGIEEARDVVRGQLAVVCVKPVSRWAMLGLALRGAVGRLGEADQIENFAVRALEVAPAHRGRDTVKVATDGETTLMRWPLRFEVSPRPLRLLRP